MPESNRGIQIERAITLIREIASHNNGITPLELAGLLDVNVRTIQRDLDAMMLDLPLTYEKRGKKNYYFFSYKLDLPADFLQLDEILILLALVENSPHWQGTTLGKSIDSTLSKLRQIISPSEMKFVRERMLPIFCQKRGFVEYKSDWMGVFSEAIENGKRLYIKYRGIGEGKTKHWRADPLMLVEHDQAFYAVVGVPRYNSVRVIALSRVLLAKESGEAEIGKYNFEAETLKKDSFGIWIGEPKRIKIHFTDWAAGYVCERFWHPSQKITQCEDNSAIIEFESGSLPEVMRWVLSFGSTAKVLEPKELVIKVRDELTKAIKNCLE